MSEARKLLGQFFTPAEVASTLTGWVIEKSSDRLLDPSCGDGRFLACHKRSVGVEFDADHGVEAKLRAPWALIHTGDFFHWAAETKERFEAVAGNPPFIRYQTFGKEVRSRSLAAASMMGAHFSKLTSSWAPFIIVAAGLLKPGGRMGFVVPAELGHAGYAKELVPALCRHFEEVRIIAYKEKLFPKLSEDCWLLVCRKFGGRTKSLRLTTRDCFKPLKHLPAVTREVSLAQWEAAGGRLRPFLLTSHQTGLYFSLLQDPKVLRHGDLATASIGYVTGGNDFFHMRPSDAARHGIPREFFKVAVRKGVQLPSRRITKAVVEGWIDQDLPVLLLDLKGRDLLPNSVRRYLDGPAGQQVRKAYKCRARKPWYGVPDVKAPDAFLPVMSGRSTGIVSNDFGCVGTNSVHTVTMKNGESVETLLSGWSSPLARLGTELEGHSLGGGMLKLEPGEAARVPIPVEPLPLSVADQATLDEAIANARSWRHCV